MRFVIVAGTPSSGKTSVMIHTIGHLLKNGILVAACKIDCLQTSDDERYRRLYIPVAVGLSDYICPAADRSGFGRIRSRACRK